MEARSLRNMADTELTWQPAIGLRLPTRSVYLSGSSPMRSTDDHVPESVARPPLHPQNNNRPQAPATQALALDSTWGTWIIPDTPTTPAGGCGFYVNVFGRLSTFWEVLSCMLGGPQAHKATRGRRCLPAKMLLLLSVFRLFLPCSVFYLPRVC